MNRSGDVIAQVVTAPAPDTPDVSIFDIWDAVRKRWRTIVIVTAVIFALGLLHAVVTSPRFAYTTLIEIGMSRDKDQQDVLVESPPNVVAKLNNTYIPLTLAQARNESPDLVVYNMSADTPGQSGLVLLESSGVAADAQTYSKLQQRVVDLLIANHARVLDVTKKNLEAGLLQVRSKLAELEDDARLGTTRKSLEYALLVEENKLFELQNNDLFQVRRQAIENELGTARLNLAAHADREKILHGRLARIEKQRELLDTHIQRIDEYLGEALRNRERAVSQLDSEVNAMMLLLLDSDIQEQRTRLTQLDERRQIAVEDQAAELTKDLQDSRRLQTQQQEQIALLELKLTELLKKRALQIAELQSNMATMRAKIDVHERQLQRNIAHQQTVIEQLTHNLERFRDTRALSHPLTSVKPTGIGKTVKAVAALIVGLILAVAVALFAEFAEKGRTAHEARVVREDTHAPGPAALPMDTKRGRALL